MIRLSDVLKAALLIMAISGSSLLLAACGGSTPERSVAAYCSYFYGEGEKLRERWEQTNGDAENPIAGMASVFQDIPETANFMHELSQRAPEDIAPDVQSLADALDHLTEQEGSAFSDPLGALAGGLMEGLAASGSEQHVNEYTVRHCGPPPGS